MHRLMLLTLISGCAALAHAKDASWNATHAAGLAVSAPSAAVLEAELQGCLLARSQGRLSINEAYLAGGANGWQWRASKKVLSWNGGRR